MPQNKNENSTPTARSVFIPTQPLRGYIRSNQVFLHITKTGPDGRNKMTNLLQLSKKSAVAAGKRLVALIVVVLCASTQIFAQTGVTIGNITTSGPNMLNVNGNLAIGTGYYTTTAPTDGAIIQGNVGIGTTTPGSFKLNVNGTVRLQTYSATSTNALLLTNTTGDLSKLDLSGSGSQYLRGDGTWGTITGTLPSGTSASQMLRWNSTLSVWETTSFILNDGVNTGVGGAPSTTQRFRINSGATQNPARFDVNGTTKFLFASNGGATIGSSSVPPTDGLYVQGAVQFNTLSSSLSTNLVTVDASGNLTKYAYGTSSQFLRGDGWQNISTIVPTGTSGQTLRYNASNVLESTSTLFNRASDGYIGIGTTSPPKQLTLLAPTSTDAEMALLPGSNTGQSSKIWLGGRTDLTAHYAALAFRQANTYLAFSGKPGSGPELQLMAMDFNNMTIGVGYDQVGNVAVNPVTTSTFLVGATSPTQAQGGVIRGVFNGVGSGSIEYYGLAGISDPTTAGRGVGVLASGDYYGLVATTTGGSPTGAILSQGNLDVTTGNVTVSSGNIIENGNAVMRWRGVLATAPVTDVQEGDMYFDSSNSKVYVRANSTWVLLN